MTTKQPCPECVETISDWLRATAFSVTSEMVRDHFLPKSPAQQLAAECPHGMTVEQAQWVLDREADNVPRDVAESWRPKA